MSVAANQLIKGQYPSHRGNFPVAASKHIYQGVLAFLASGYLTDVIASGANNFAGIVVREVDNSAGSNGDLRAEVYTDGVFYLTGSGFTQASVGSLAYASDNYTVTATSTNNTKIGRIAEYVSSTIVGVKLDTVQA